MKRPLIGIILLLLIPCIYAQSFITDSDRTNEPGEIESPKEIRFEKPHKWALETSLTFPFGAKIYMLKGSYRISPKSELGFGPAFQNWENTDKTPRGQANAYTLLLSYRYYFYRNFNVEIELWPAYNFFDSYVDGRTYKGLELWAEHKIGYRVDLTPNIYLNVQPGIGHGIWMEHKWPGWDDYSSWELIGRSMVFVPQIIVGWNF